MIEPISGEQLHQISVSCGEISCEECNERTAALMARIAKLEAEAKAHGEWKGQLDTYRDQWRRHYEKQIAEFETEKEQWFARHLNEEADDLRAVITELEADRDLWIDAAIKAIRAL